MWHSNRPQVESGSSRDPYDGHAGQPRFETIVRANQEPLVPQAPIREITATTIGFFTLVGLLVLMRRVINYWKHNELVNSRSSHQACTAALPCQNCQYFNPSAFLYCAVNPTTAMTPEAANCSDFCQRQERGRDIFTH